jgi:hypothetical protein
VFLPGNRFSFKKKYMMRFLLAFLFLSSSLPGSSQAQQDVKKQIDSLTSFIKNKATESFAGNTVYRGEDAERKWKDVYNPANPGELKAAKAMLEEMKKALAGCSFKEFDVFQQKEQSEGTWYVYTYACGAYKRVKLAFLKINGKYALGDIDVEEDNDED